MVLSPISPAFLSTPHGALGTNLKVKEVLLVRVLLSTPHGALGTCGVVGKSVEDFSFQLHTVH